MLPLHGGFFDIDTKLVRLGELELVTQAPEFWNDNDAAKVILQERATCQGAVDIFKSLERMLSDAGAALELSQEMKDYAMLEEALSLVENLEREVGRQEFLYKMKQPYDRFSAIIEINAGSGGTEAQDWADMLLRMYLRWAERKGFTLEELDYQAGESAGIKSATIFVEGRVAFTGIFDLNPECTGLFASPPSIQMLGVIPPLPRFQ